MSDTAEKRIEEIKEQLEEIREWFKNDTKWFTKDFEPPFNRFCEAIAKSDKDDEYIIRGFRALMNLMSMRIHEPYAKAYMKKLRYEKKYSECSDPVTYYEKDGKLMEQCKLYFDRKVLFAKFCDKFLKSDNWKYEYTEEDTREILGPPITITYGSMDVDYKTTFHKRNIEALEELMGEKFPEYDNYMGRYLKL